MNKKDIRCAMLKIIHREKNGTVDHDTRGAMSLEAKSIKQLECILNGTREEVLIELGRMINEG